MPAKTRFELVGEHTNSADDLPAEVAAGEGRFRFGWQTLRGGASEGVPVLMIDTGPMSIAILPNRGMSLWKAWSHEVSQEPSSEPMTLDDCLQREAWEIGWQSPVRGPKHPSIVPLADPSGLGWLEGFDELFVRCGLRTNGAPQFDGNGRLEYALHGRIANLPASQLTLEVDSEKGHVDIHATIFESRFLFYSLSLQTHIRCTVNSEIIEIFDSVKNLGSQPTDSQLLYHINLGQPVLEAGSQLHALLKRLAPKDDRAANGVADWSRCEGPVTGFSEQVYLCEAMVGDDGWSSAMLTDSTNSRGIAVDFHTQNLPYLNLWKNTAAVDDGYVVGIEPATGFPNTHQFEKDHGRVVGLEGGQTRTYKVRLNILSNSSQVVSKINAIAGQQKMPCQTLETPNADWSR
jgi:hypothetical protein